MREIKNSHCYFNIDSNESIIFDKYNLKKYNSNKDEMLKVRSVITGKLSEYMQGEGYTLSQNSRYSHSLDSFLFTYTNSGGRPDVIKVEINYYVWIVYLNIINNIK